MNTRLLSVFLTSLFFTTLASAATLYDDYPVLYEEEILQPQPTLQADMLNLESTAQDFVLSTKKIEIPNAPDAFNPSLIRWRGTLLFSYRHRLSITASTNPMVLVWMDDDFNLISEPQELHIPFYNPYFPSKQQDPRLIAIGDRLFITYSNLIEGDVKREIRRMYIAEVIFEGGKFHVKDRNCLLHYQDQTEMRWEKNWVPFEHNNELLLAYSLVPHRIFRPHFGTGACETLYETKGNIEWDWGVLRGGTTALRVGDAYLAFFHSSKNIATTHSGGRIMPHYVMGAYTFSLNPPFGITAISPEPIVGEKFYDGPAYKTWKPLRIVFPCGFVFDEEFIWVAYGRQDHESWIVKLDRKGLLDSLVPVISK